MQITSFLFLSIESIDNKHKDLLVDKYSLSRDFYFQWVDTRLLSYRQVLLLRATKKSRKKYKKHL